ncbi:MAG: DUF3368 domain-containing protein [Acidobacteriota bacterium]
MIVISDTSPLNYLVLIELEGILPALFGEIVLPTAVFEELHSAAAPEKLRAWLGTSPRWIRIEAAPAITPDLMGLGAGEREVIALGLHSNASLVLLDEARGRRMALERGLAVAGTLGILERAARQGMIRLSEAVDRLRHTSFRASPRLLESLREADGSELA